MRVLHVIAGITRSGGGPSRSSQGLVAAQRTMGIDAWLMTLNHGEEPWIKGVDKFVNGRDFEVVLADVKPNIVHIHGIWNYYLHRCAVICRRRRIPYVIAPRGMLEPWSLKVKWFKKLVARFLYQNRDLKLAAALHATAESEAAQFRKLGFRNYCIISPNGVNVPDSLPVFLPSAETSKRALFVSRMHKKKGVLELVESWARVRPQGWKCELVYTVNGEEELQYEEKVKARVACLGLSTQFIFTGALDDAKKWDAYARANLFVLPTRSENFGIVISEALYSGVPVITTKGTPWSDLVSSKCGWWIDLPLDDISEKGREWPALDLALGDACGSKGLQELSEMGRNGRALVEAKFLWPAVVKPFLHGYNQILNSCEMAPCDSCQNYGDICPIRN